jgi:hypothetical protein
VGGFFAGGFVVGVFAEGFFTAGVCTGGFFTAVVFVEVVFLGGAFVEDPFTGHEGAGFLVGARRPSTKSSTSRTTRLVDEPPAVGVPDPEGGHALSDTSATLKS